MHKWLFEPIQLAVRERKASQVFHQLRAKSRARTVTFPVTLGRMNVAHYNKAFGTFRRVFVEGHALHITGTISCYCFLHEWAINTSKYEKLITQ